MYFLDEGYGKEYKRSSCHVGKVEGDSPLGSYSNIARKNHMNRPR